MLFPYRHPWPFLLIASVIFVGYFSNLANQTLPQQTAAPPELVLQRGHSLGVICAVYSPDGNWIASGSADNSIVIWETSTGHELRSLDGHTGYIRALAVSNDSKLIASAGNDRTIKVWDVETGQAKFDLQGTNSPVTALAFSPAGKWLASGDAEKTIRIWDLSSQKEVTTLTRHHGPVTTLSFSPNGSLLISVAKKEVILWNTKDWQPLAKQPVIGETVNAVTFNASGQRFACATADGAVLLFQVGSEREQFLLKKDSSNALAVSLSNDDSIFVVHASGAVEQWNSQTGKSMNTIAAPPNSNQALVATISPGARSYLIGDGGRNLILRGIGNDDFQTLTSRASAINAIAFSDDGRWFASANSDASIRLWQVATGRELPRLLGHSGYITAIAFSPDSQTIASGSRSGELKLWDVETGALSLSLPTQAKSINLIAFNPDGKSLAVVGMDQRLEIWDLQAKLLKSLSGHTAEVTSVVFSSDGKVMVTAGRDKSIRVWDTTSGTSVATLDSPAEVNCLALSRDDRFLAVGNADKSIIVFDWSKRTVLRTLSGHNGEVLSVAFSPDGQMLASGSADQNILLWESNSGTRIKQLRANVDSVTSVTFTGDGRWIVAASDDGTITVWSSTGDKMATLVSVPNSNDWLVATPDGLFDGSPDAWNLLLWRFGNNTFNALPVEAYFNEFYYPGVLAEIFSGRNPKPTEDIVKKDRRQPRVKLNSANASDTVVTTRNLEIELEVMAAPPDEDHNSSSGARDVRLFRNGFLVKTWTGDVLHNTTSQKIMTTVPLVSGENHFVAYAFNNDNIKSADASLNIRAAANLKRQGTAYLLVIGVEQYENPQYNLKYPVADATEMGEQLKSQQERLGHYNPVVPIRLVNSEATKQNILLALARLSGTNTGPLPSGAPASLANIRPAQPEDAVVIYFSGHGTAIGDHFYLIPTDLGYEGNRDKLDSNGLETILSHSISDEELESALQSLDADQLLLVIDACNSGQAVESEEKRRGPMNTRGLAQLAYEKGIYVLTASQSMEVAFEAETLKHSYLAYALLEEGIKTGAADEDRDGRIYLNEWFAYATERVPQIRRQRYQQRKELVEEEATDQKVQRPRVFYTRENGAKHFLVASR